MERRQFLAGAAAMSLLPAADAAAQILPGPGFGTPLGTRPFAPDVYRARRARLMAELKTGLAVIHGATAIGAPDNTIAAPFTQNGDFAWPTGISDEPGAVLVPAPGGAGGKAVLFLPAADFATARLWVEGRAGG